MQIPTANGNPTADERRFTQINTEAIARPNAHRYSITPLLHYSIAPPLRPRSPLRLLTLSDGLPPSVIRVAPRLLAIRAAHLSSLKHALQAFRYHAWPFPLHKMPDPRQFDPL